MECGGSVLDEARVVPDEVVQATWRNRVLQTRRSNRLVIRTDTSVSLGCGSSESCHTGIMSSAQGLLFDSPLPNGFHYRDGFISVDDEVRLVAEIARIEFSNYEMRGVVARRRVAFFGRSYDSSVTVTPNLPPFLVP